MSKLLTMLAIIFSTTSFAQTDIVAFQRLSRMIKKPKAIVMFEHHNCKWCPFLKGLLERSDRKYPGLQVIFLDVEKNFDIAKMLGLPIASLPAMVVFVDYLPKYATAGMPTGEQYNSLIRQIMDLKTAPLPQKNRNRKEASND